MPVLTCSKTLSTSPLLLSFLLLLLVQTRLSVPLTFAFTDCADPSGFILFPLVVHSFDLVISSVGILSIRGTRDSGAKGSMEDPMAILERGYSITVVLAVLTFGAVIH